MKSSLRKERCRFSGDDVMATGLDKSKLDSILAENHLKAGVAKETAKDAGKAIKPLRIGLYRPFTASMDEGWTRWILEQYKFPFKSLENADITGGHLHQNYDVIVIPDINERQILPCSVIYSFSILL